MFEDLLTTESSWEFLKNTPLPIAVYGTGNGADRVFEEFEHLGITVSAVVASDGFVRKRTFREFEVKSISGLENEIGDFVIALAFASPRTEVIENIKTLSLCHKIVMPSVPVYGDDVFNKNFLKKHFDEIELAYSYLADEQSKKVFENIIKFQITGDLNYCFNCESEKDEAFEILNLGDNESFLDLGAYRGDTVEEFLKYTKSYKKIVAVEPDTRTFKKLQLNCENLENCTTLNNAIWSENCVLTFDGNKGRGASAKSQGEEKNAICVDYITEKYGDFSYLNIDIEGAESEMLKGACLTLANRPKICMAVYHKSEDIFALVNKIKEINSDYKIYLRHHKHISFWDTNIYCI
ncbi:MAG: FkbM family methyltransferase [Ruminococcaceae bacterium]|nr:FkbM family methyltransferase [Oscillospiraceae bacterium]